MLLLLLLPVLLIVVQVAVAVLPQPLHGLCSEHAVVVVKADFLVLPRIMFAATITISAVAFNKFP